eukprot:3075678-Pyramimonas_sp.AAC.1
MPTTLNADDTSRACRFRQGKAQEIISEVLKTKLTNVTYHPDNTSTWTREIADDIKGRLKEMGLERYKFVVQVVIGEQRGEGNLRVSITQPLKRSTADPKACRL